MPANFKPSSHFVEVQTVEQFEAMLAVGRPMLVDFHGERCGPCEQLRPTLHELADRYVNRVTVAGVDVGKVRDLAVQYQVRSLPAVLIFANGKLSERIGGVKPAELYASILDKLTAQEK
jgi:thioredoxin 1